MDSNIVIQRQFNMFGSLTGLGEKHGTCIPCKASRNYRVKSLCCFHCFKGKLSYIQKKKKKKAFGMPGRLENLLGRLQLQLDLQSGT